MIFRFSNVIGYFSGRGLFFLKLLTVPTAAFFWYLYYKSKKNDEDQLYIMHTTTADEDTTAAEGFKVIRVKVPSKAVGAIIGKQGSVIKKIQQLTRTTIHFVDRSVATANAQSEDDAVWSSSEGDNPSNDKTDFEEILIRGLVSRVVEAERHVLEVIESVPDIISEDMFVQQRYLGKIIGRGGENIRRLRNNYRVQLTIERDTGIPKSGSGSDADKELRRITLKGTKDQLDGARAAINCMILESEENARKFGTSNTIKKISPQITPNDESRADSQISLSQYSDTVEYPPSRPPSQIFSSSHNITNGDSSCNTPSQADLKPDDILTPYTVPFPEEGRDRWQRIMVSSVSNCANFFAHLVCTETVALDGLVEHMTTYFGKLERKGPYPEFYEGQLVAGYYPPDNTWQRAKIVSIRQSNGSETVDSSEGQVAEVDYLDYGDFYELKGEQMWPLAEHPEFLQLPFQAVRLILYGIEPVGGPTVAWPDEAITYFEQMTMTGQSQVLSGRICGPPLPPGATPTVELEDRSGRSVVNIASHLVDKGYAQWIKDVLVNDHD